MPTFSVVDPAGLAYACASLETVWARLTANNARLLGAPSAERHRLSCIIASLAWRCDEAELVDLALSRFLSEKI